MRTPARSLGFTLFEVALALIIITVGSLFAFQAMLREQERRTATLVGEQVRTLAGAVNTYIVNNYPTLTATASSAVDLATLRAQSLLPASFTDTNVQGSTYTIRLLRTGTAPNWNIEGVVVTNNPVTDGVNPSLNLAGVAVAAIGADGGLSYDGTTLSGAQGSWSHTQANFPAITQIAQVGARVGAGTSQFTQFLRRDGSLPMTGALNMGGQSINSAQNLTLSGHASMNTGEVRLVVTENTSCATYSNGAFARTNEGLLLSCQSGTWKKASGSGGGGRASFKSFIEFHDGQTLNFYFQNYWGAYVYGVSHHMVQAQFCASCGTGRINLYYRYDPIGWYLGAYLDMNGYNLVWFPYSPWYPNTRIIGGGWYPTNIDVQDVYASFTPSSFTFFWRSSSGGCNGYQSLTLTTDQIEAGMRSATVMEGVGAGC